MYAISNITIIKIIFITKINNSDSTVNALFITLNANIKH